MGVRRGPRAAAGHCPSVSLRRGTLAVAAALLAVVALPALAQTSAHAAPTGDDPYGSTTTTADHGPKPSCRLRETTVAPGDTDTARLKAVPRGSEVEIRFDGRVVAKETASGPGKSPRVNVNIDFVVPSDATSGDHDVTAVSSEFTAPCGTVTIPDGEVLGETVTNDGTGGSWSLPKTGVYVALLLVLGVALVIVGRAVLEASRQRARAAQAHRHRISSHR
jgi:hypothetical protein